MKILKNIPIPGAYGVTSSCFEPLLKMKIGDCVEFTDNYNLRAATRYLRTRGFKIKTKTIKKHTFGVLDFENGYLGRLWRIK